MFAVRRVSAGPARQIDAVQQLKINSHVNNHNLSILLGWLFSLLPSGNLAYKANLASAFAGSLAIVLFYAALVRIFSSRLTAALSALILMVSHSMWWHSTISEVYALNALFTVSAIYLIAQYQQQRREQTLYGLCFISGLAVFNHIQMGALVCGAGVLTLGHALRERGAARVLFCSALCLLLGLSPYLITLLKDILISGDAAKIIAWAVGGDFRGIMFKGSWGGALYDLAYLIFNQFPSPALFLVVYGLYRLARTWRADRCSFALLTMFTVTTTFFMFYNTWDKFAFLLPSFVLLSFAAAFGVHSCIGMLKARPSRWSSGAGIVAAVACVVMPPYMYSHQAIWGADMNSVWHRRYNNRYTDNTYSIAEYIANPNKRGNRDIEEFCLKLLDKLPKHAVFFDDDSRGYFPVAEYFQRYYGLRPDLQVNLINSWGFANWGVSPASFKESLEQAYRTGGDFFLSSLQSPFQQALAAMPERYTWRRFPLDEHRWVYRLVTAHEAHDYGSVMRGGWEELSLDRKVRINLIKENILSSRGGVLHEQVMTGFAGSWLHNDQILLASYENGGEFSMLLRLKSAQPAVLKVAFTTGPDFGRTQFLLNNKEVDEPIDAYTPEVARRVISTHTIELEQGNNILTFRNVGKNISASAFHIGIDMIVLAAVKPG